jgi:hypothetical protein
MPIIEVGSNICLQTKKAELKSANGEEVMNV